MKIARLALIGMPSDEREHGIEMGLELGSHTIRVFRLGSFDWDDRHTLLVASRMMCCSTRPSEERQASLGQRIGVAQL